MLYCVFRNTPSIRFLGCFESEVYAQACVTEDKQRLLTRNMLVNDFNYEIVPTELNETRNWELD